MLKTDLEKELRKIHRADEDAGVVYFVDEVRKQLEEEVASEEEIRERLREFGISADIPALATKMDELEPENLFTKDQVKKLAIKYRLRFLDTGYFNGEIPEEAIQKVRKLEQRLGIQIDQFKVLAPGKLFLLEDCDKDPMLFADAGYNRYYLIHRWGAEINLLRRIIAYPLRSLEHYVVTLICFSAFCAAVAPESWIVWETPMGIGEGETSWSMRGMVFVHLLVSLCALSVLLGSTFFKSFTNIQWDSHLFKRSRLL